LVSERRRRRGTSRNDQSTKDLFITNGMYRRPNDLDYINYVSNIEIQKTLAMSLPDRITEKNLSLVQKMPQVPLASFAFRNNGDLTFTNQADPWGLAQPGFSNGAAYVDLDNDGALSLLRRLRSSGSYIHFAAQNCRIHFRLDPDEPIEVEIMSIVDEFWAASEVSDSQAESIIGVAYRGERFSSVIPGTEEEWGAWSNLTQVS